MNQATLFADDKDPVWGRCPKVKELAETAWWPGKGAPPKPEPEDREPGRARPHRVGPRPPKPRG